MPSGRHAGPKPLVPFVGLLVAIAVVVLGLVAAGPLLSRGDGNPPGGAGSPTPSVPSKPSAEPSPASSPAPEEPKRGPLLIHGTGDVNLDPNYIPTFRSTGYAHAWTGLKGLFTRDDLTVVNLECAVSRRGSPLPKSFTFRCDPDALPSMREAGVEVANLGNNHAYDYGPEALVDSIRLLRRNGIAAVGAGRTQAEALRPATFELNGWTVAVVGLDQVVDPWPEAVATTTKPGTAAGHDTGLMIRAIRQAKRVADLVVVTIHWGVELDTQPRPEQVALGERMVDAGADVIFGHHSHRLQPLTMYQGRPIFWGLGNFVWPSLSVEGSTTAVAEVRVTPKGRFKARLIPTYIESHGHPVLRGG